MNTGRLLGPNRSASMWISVVSAIVLIFALPGGDAVAESRDGQNEARLNLVPATSRTSVEQPVFSNSRFKLEGRLGVGTEMLTSETTEGNNAAFGASARLKYNFLESLSLNAETVALFSSERFQAQLDTDEFANGIYAKRFDVVFQPVPYFQLGAGGVNQKEFLDRPLLLSNRAFPGVYAQGNLQSGKNGFYLRVGQYIPTSRSFDSDRQEKEDMPSLTLLETKAIWSPNRYFQISPSFTHFTYENLPSIVAYNSNFRGNSVEGQTRPNSVFEYDFRGYVAGMELKLTPNRNLGFTLSTQLIENLDAPETLNSGQIASLSSEMHYNQMIFKPIVGGFYNEPDTAPGAYNRGELGHNNREGTFVGFDVDFVRYNFRLSTRYVQADLINKDEFEYQFDQTYVAVMLETLYVVF